MTGIRQFARVSSGNIPAPIGIAEWRRVRCAVRALGEDRRDDAGHGVRHRQGRQPQHRA
jgi:hypothetical protein